MVTVARHALPLFSHSSLLSVVDKIIELQSNFKLKILESFSSRYALSNLTLSGTATAHRTLSGARRDALEKVEEIYTLVL